jgi:hypothetical protein
MHIDTFDVYLLIMLSNLEAWVINISNEYE